MVNENLVAVWQLPHPTDGGCTVVNVQYRGVFFAQMGGHKDLLMGLTWDGTCVSPATGLTIVALTMVKNVRWHVCNPVVVGKGGCCRDGGLLEGGEVCGQK